MTTQSRLAKRSSFICGNTKTAHGELHGSSVTITTRWGSKAKRSGRESPLRDLFPTKIADCTIQISGPREPATLTEHRYSRGGPLRHPTDCPSKTSKNDVFATREKVPGHNTSSL